MSDHDQSVYDRRAIQLGVEIGALVDLEGVVTRFRTSLVETHAVLTMLELAAAASCVITKGDPDSVALRDQLGSATSLIMAMLKENGMDFEDLIRIGQTIMDEALKLPVPHPFMPPFSEN